MKPILAIDLDGALMYSRPFDQAHKRWFSLMANLLNDPSINDYAGLENYFPKVDEVMKKYLGNMKKEARTAFARQIYAMVTVAETRKEDSVSEFVRFLRKIKSKYSLALITSAPEAAVEPILQKINGVDLFEFDMIYKSPANRQPSKKELLQEFIGDHGKPKFYIGNGDTDILSCRELGIPTISVNWVSKGEHSGDYQANTVKDLEKLLVKLS